MVLDGTIYPGTNGVATITALWSSDSGPASPGFTTPTYSDANATFTLPGLYQLRLTATAPGPVTVADTRPVSVMDTYATWAARTLASSPSGLRGMVDDADLDGLNNLAEFVLGSNPADAGSVPAIEGFLDAGVYKVRWSRNRFADPAILIIPQICVDLGVGLWSENPADVQYWPTTLNGNFQGYEAADQHPGTPDDLRYFRLKIVSP
jgi:hypothetical protein